MRCHVRHTGDLGDDRRLKTPRCQRSVVCGVHGALFGVVVQAVSLTGTRCGSSGFRV